MGHGNSEGTEFNGLDATRIVPSGTTAPLIWFHACNCGRRLIHDVAALGCRSVGFADLIPYQLDGDDTVEVGRLTLESLPPGVQCEDLIAELRDAWFRLVKERLTDGDIFTAAIASHVRLNARCTDP